MAEPIRRMKPFFITSISDAEWHAMSEAEQLATENNFRAANKGAALPKAATTTPSTSTATAIAPEQPKVSIPTTTTSLQTPEVLVGIRNWVESVTTQSGRTIPASRLRDCIVYQLDIKKDPWWSARMTRGLVKAMAEKLDADTPEDFIYEKDPLFGFKRIRSEAGEFLISTIERHPRNEAERARIRNKFGITAQTIPFLAKKSCPKCKGTGVYEVLSYPNDPLYNRLTETVECDCSYE